jgi:hypothetical protein
MKVSVSPMYVQALSMSKRSIKEVYITSEYLADRKKQHIRDRVARHRKEKRKHSNVVKEDMLNEEDVIKIKQQQLRDRVARHRMMKRSQDNNNTETNQGPTCTMARHYNQINGQNFRNSENSFLKDEINESEVNRVLIEMAKKRKMSILKTIQIRGVQLSVLFVIASFWMRMRWIM